MKCPICAGMIEQEHFGSFRSPSDKIWITKKNHPKLQFANKLIEVARQLEQNVREEQKKDRKSLIAEWKYTIKQETKNPNHFDPFKEPTKGFRVTMTLSNGHLFKEHLETYGSIMNAPEEKRKTVFYFRLHGVLFHCGGGYLLLNDMRPCSDDEWEKLLTGDFTGWLK